MPTTFETRLKILETDGILVTGFYKILINEIISLITKATLNSLS